MLTHPDCSAGRRAGLAGLGWLAAVSLVCVYAFTTLEHAIGEPCRTRFLYVAVCSARHPLT